MISRQMARLSGTSFVFKGTVAIFVSFIIIGILMKNFFDNQ
jgi:hypothetical protein